MWHYYGRPATPVAGRASHYDLPLMFISSLFFSPRNLSGPLADHHQTLPHIRW